MKDQFSLFDKMPPPFTKMGDLRRSDDVFFIKKENYEIIAIIGPILFVVHKLSVIPDTWARTYYLQVKSAVAFS